MSSVVKLSEAIKAQKGKAKRVKLINGEVLDGTIQNVYGEMFTIKMPSQGAGQPEYTVPFTAILYISNCDL